ncbi:starch-binding protein [Halonatronum saccharophilum]|uniref:starch-binding protein n=1 Tax=Halonatronum saccharophilum TaxID=150060 RepID=UPI00048211BD|nr:starch-binding protein [Halonatronum saccharophilum]
MKKFYLLILVLVLSLSLIGCSGDSTDPIDELEEFEFKVAVESPENSLATGKIEIDDSQYKGFEGKYEEGTELNIKAIEKDSIFLGWRAAGSNEVTDKNREITRTINEDTKMFALFGEISFEESRIGVWENNEVQLPTITVTNPDGNQEEVMVDWDRKDGFEVVEGKVTIDEKGSYEFFGTPKGYDTDQQISLTIEVLVEGEIGIELDLKPSQPPSTISGQAYTSNIGSGVELTWEDNADYYLVYRGDNQENRAPLFRSPIIDSTFKDYTAEVDREYYYWVRAIDEGGMNSNFSESIKAKAGGYDGIKLHYKDTQAPRIHIWGATDSSFNTEWTNRPHMDDAGDGWYVAEFPDEDSLGLIFEGTSGQSGDQQATKGDWWFMDGEWYPYNPDYYAKPEISINLDSGTYPAGVEVVVSIAGMNLEGIRIRVGNQVISEEDNYIFAVGDYIAEGETDELVVEANNSNGEAIKRVEITNSEPEADFIIYFMPPVDVVPNIYTWEPGEVFGGWPGAPMLSVGNGWYMAYVEEAQMVEFKLNWDGGATGDLEREAGTWWLHNSIWYEEEPDLDDIPEQLWEFTFDPTEYGLSADNITNVHLTGAMNGWDPNNTDYTLERQGDLWIGIFDIPAGTPFKWIVDGAWTPGGAGNDLIVEESEDGVSEFVE